MADKKPPVAEFTAQEIDRLIQIVAAAFNESGTQADADLIAKCAAIQPGHIVGLPTSGTVVRE